MQQSAAVHCRHARPLLPAAAMQIISSAIVNAPPPHPVVKMLMRTNFACELLLWMTCWHGSAWGADPPVPAALLLLVGPACPLNSAAAPHPPPCQPTWTAGRGRSWCAPFACLLLSSCSCHSCAPCGKLAPLRTRCASSCQLSTAMLVDQAGVWGTLSASAGARLLPLPPPHRQADCAAQLVSLPLLGRGWGLSKGSSALLDSQPAGPPTSLPLVALWLHQMQVRRVAGGAALLAAHGAARPAVRRPALHAASGEHRPPVGLRRLT